VIKIKLGKMEVLLELNEPKAIIHEVKSLNDRIAFIKGQIYKALVDPKQKIRQLALEIIEGCESKDYECYVAKIFHFVQANVKYVRDYEGLDTYQHPLRTLQFGGADCDDFAILNSALLMSIGIPVKLRVIKTKKTEDWSHIYTMAGLPPTNPTYWVALDQTVKGAYLGWEAPKSLIKEKKDFRLEFFTE
jgi:transglutaminase-like putative cysteine protease